VYLDELNHRHSTYSLNNQPEAKPDKKSFILSQNLLFSPRFIKLRWFFLLSCLPLFGIFTAFGLVPQAEQQWMNHIDEEVALPLLKTSTQANHQTYAYIGQVKSKDTLNNVLDRLNVRDKHAAKFIKDKALSLTNNNDLQAGQNIIVKVNSEGILSSLDLLDNKEIVHVSHATNQQLVAKKVPVDIESRQELKSATITHSLFASSDLADVPDSVAVQLIKIFESEIDFHREIQKGDQFKIIYQADFHAGKRIGAGPILAVEFINKRKKYTAIGFPDHKGKMEYYTLKGKSLGKTFLRSPLEYTRITSGFSRARFHPVLQRIRAHKGVDMAAPTGTKIRAAGNATVEFAGWKGGYGRVVILKHAKGVKTVYGHLSKFARNLKKGKSIKQGQIIGYVGKSGMATGPHLHYEFLKNGKHLDPMKVALPKTTQISGSSRVKFLHQSRKMQAKLKLLEHTNIAALQ